MATGEKSWAQSKPHKYESLPIQPGDYELKVLADTAKIGKRPEPGKFSYVSCAFEVLNTATNDGGKNRVVYNNFFIKTKPGKDGKAMVSRADQILGLCYALGDHNPDIDDSFKQNGEECLNPNDLLQYLKSHDGEVVRAKIKTQREQNGYAAKSIIGEFLFTEEEGQPAEEYEMEEGEGEAVDLGASEEQSEEEVLEEVEALPPVRPAQMKNGASKQVVKLPAAVADKKLQTTKLQPAKRR